MRSVRCCGSPTWVCSPYPCWRRWSSASFLADGVIRLLKVRDGIPADEAVPLGDLQVRRGQQPEGVPRQLLPHDRIGQNRPLRRRAGPGHRQHQGSVHSAACLRRHPAIGCRGCGAATSMPATGRRCRTRRCSRSRCTNSSTSSTASRRAGRCCARRSAVAREYFGDTLVSVTGAGSGIGRATALAFAREGAELVISDIDEAGVKDTAAQIAARGGVAHAYTLDVADAEAVERFAEQVSAEHGVPDIVVNNAGVGQAGLFLDTPREEYDRVLDINFGGVVNCCRSFGRRLVDRGTGGHIVNVSSMAAYSPQQMMNAYATSKAAVFMFGDCLRAELDSAGDRADDGMPRCHRHEYRAHHPLRRPAGQGGSRSKRVVHSSRRRSPRVDTVRTRWPRPSCPRSRRTSRSGPSHPRRTSSTASPTCCRR